VGRAHPKPSEGGLFTNSEASGPSFDGQAAHSTPPERCGANRPGRAVAAASARSEQGGCGVLRRLVEGAPEDAEADHREDAERDRHLVPEGDPERRSPGGFGRASFAYISRMSSR